MWEMIVWKKCWKTTMWKICGKKFVWKNLWINDW